MAIGESAPEPVVVGTRLPFWKSMTWGEVAFEVASPFLVVWAAIWFVGLARGCGHLTDDQNIGHNVWGTIFYSVVAIAGIAGTSTLRSYVKANVLVSACPRCGVQQQRAFEPPQQFQTPTRCGACIAYLRATGLEVREERRDTVDQRLLRYWVEPAAFLPVAQRNDAGALQFAMPTMCAICGVADAPNQSRIGDEGHVPTPGLGAIGTIATYAADEVATDAQLYVRGRLAHNAPTAPTSGNQLDDSLRHLTVPVCAAHVQTPQSDGPAIAFNAGRLQFASYGYYKAFCELNHITTAKPALAG